MAKNSNHLMYDKEMYIVEGINVDEFRKTVSLTDDHDKGVDFSNHHYITNKMNLSGQRVNVYSIFARTEYQGEYQDLDGNPFIYALKKKDGWKFNITDDEIVHYIRKFLKVCNTIDKQYDTIVTVPSSHSINVRFMRVIAERVKSKNNISDMFRKCSKAEVLADLDTEAIEDYCYDKYPRTADIMYDNIVNDIRAAFGKMKGRYFEAKLMPKQYIRFCPSVVSIEENFDIDDAYRFINNKNVLVLDDTISSGKSVSDCVRAISDFGPKKLDVITLLSKKMR